MPRPVEDWPDGPVTESKIRTAFESRQETDEKRENSEIPLDATVFGVWGLTRTTPSRRSVVDGELPEKAVLDLVIESPDKYRMYSYTHHNGSTQWISYDIEPKGTEGADRLESTLSHFDLLCGESDLV